MAERTTIARPYADAAFEAAREKRFLRGSGLDVLWPEALTLLGMGLAILTVASLRFRKRLD